MIVLVSAATEDGDKVGRSWGGKKKILIERRSVCLFSAQAAVDVDGMCDPLAADGKLWWSREGRAWDALLFRAQ